MYVFGKLKFKITVSNHSLVDSNFNNELYELVKQFTDVTDVTDVKGYRKKLKNKNAVRLKIKN